MAVKRAPAAVIPLHTTRRPDPEVTDAQLVAAVATRDREALGTLYERHGGAVAAFLQRMGHVDADAVDDLLQDVFVAVASSAARYRGTSAVRTWILAIAANHARVAARSAIRRKSAWERLARFRSVDARRTPRDPAEGSELLQRLHQEIVALPHALRVAFILCDVEDVPGVEAAEALGVPTGTLYRRVHAARRKLRARFEGEWP